MSVLCRSPLPLTVQMEPFLTISWPEAHATTPATLIVPASIPLTYIYIMHCISMCLYTYSLAQQSLLQPCTLYMMYMSIAIVFFVTVCSFRGLCSSFSTPHNLLQTQVFNLIINFCNHLHDFVSLAASRIVFRST